MSIGVARLRSRAGQLAAVGATAVVLAAVAVGMVGTLETGIDAAVRGAAAEPGARTIVANADADRVAESATVAFALAPVLVEDVAGDTIVRPDPERVGSGDLVALRDGALRMPDRLVEDGVATRTAVSGGMAEWAQELLDLGWRARLLAVVPLLVVTAGGALAARDVVRVLQLSRVAEFAVIRSRGASRARILVGEVREVLLVGTAGAVVGGAVAGVVTGPPLGLALAGTALVPLALAAIAVPVVRRAIPSGRSDEAARASGRARAAGIVGVAVLFAATALALWRLVTTGAAADPVGIAAPALGILSAAVLVLAVVGLAARLADAGTRRWLALGPALAVRRVARRLAVFATVVLLVAVAAASTVFAAAFAATGERVAADVRQLDVGADLRVASWPVGADPAALPARAATALLVNPGEFGDDEPLVLLARADRLADVVRPLPGVVDPSALAASLEVPAVGLPLPDGTTALRVATTTTPGVQLRLWVMEPSGRVRSVALDGAAIPGPMAAVLGLDADVSRATGDISARVTALTATTAAGEVDVPVPTDWEPQFVVFGDFAPGAGAFGVETRFATAPDGLGFDLGRSSRDQVAVRLMPPGEAAQPIPVVVSAAFATRNGLETGSTVEVRFAGTGRYLLGTVADVVPAVPGAGDADAVLADLPAFAVQQLRLTADLPDAPGLLLAADDPDAVRVALPDGVTATGLGAATADRMLGIARSLLWLAAAGTLAAAVVGTAGVSASLVAERRRETRILAVLGETPARQARGQRLELGLTIALSGVLGAGAGLLLAVATVPSFARAAAPGSSALPDVALALDATGLAAALGAGAVGLGLVVVAHGLRVVRGAAARRTP